MKGVSSAILASVGLFVAGTAAALAVYPGGTWEDRSTRGFDPLNTLLCDLLLPVALDGTPNRLGSTLATAAMIALVAALVLALWSARWLVPERPTLTRWIRGCVAVSIPGLLLVPLSPPSVTGRFDGFHAAAVFVGGVPVLVAAVLTLVGVQGRLRLLGVVGVVLIVADIAVFAEYLSHGGEVPLALPLLERPALLAMLAWLTWAALILRRQARAHA